MASGQVAPSMPHGSSRSADQIATDLAAQIRVNMTEAGRVFLLSPARIGGPRSVMLLREQAEFDLAIRLRQGAATIGEIYAFISGLYFRGKLAYTDVFSAAPRGIPPRLVIVPGMGLVPPETILTYDQLQSIAKIPVDAGNTAYSGPFLRDAALLDQRAGSDCRHVLLGSIATEKYTRPLLEVFGERLLVPAEFVGRGDMSRGGLMLRCAQSPQELTYIAVQGAARHGSRPPKLKPLRTR